MRARVAILLAVTLPACSKVSPPDATPAPTASVATTPTPIASVAASVAVPAASETPGSELPPLVYRTYANGRFAFSVDAPTFFKASPPPTNGDGQEWTWGGRATMTASGIANAGSMTTQDMCKDDFAKRKGATVKSITATTCWISGKDAGQIYWEKTILTNDVFYSLRLRYDEQLKAAFDPVVTHVNASWKVPKGAAPAASAPATGKCPAGWLDGCGGCFQPCEADRDCKTHGEHCQPIVCAHESFGMGCAP